MNVRKIIVIPGNPGFKGYYDEYVQHLQGLLKSNVDIQVNPHKGHNEFKHEKYYTLNDQIQHHEMLLEEESETPLLLIGHSIGCYIIMQILKNKIIENKVSNVFMLFPTVERMAETKMGQKATRFSRPYYFSFILWFYTILLWIMPGFIKRFLICRNLNKNYFKIKQSDCLLKTTEKLLTKNGLWQMATMGKHEMHEVLDLSGSDWNVLETNWNKIHWYYGLKDDWCPKEYYEDMATRAVTSGLSTNQLHLDQHKIDHAFVINHSKLMAELCVNWIIPTTTSSTSTNTTK